MQNVYTGIAAQPVNPFVFDKYYLTREDFDLYLQETNIPYILRCIKNDKVFLNRYIYVNLPEESIREGAKLKCAVFQKRQDAEGAYYLLIAQLDKISMGQGSWGTF